MVSEEEGVEAQPAGSFLERCEQQWQRTSQHARDYPYVWASYIVTFGGLGIYGAWRWRELRRVENQIMHYQRELLKNAQKAEETALPLKQPPVETKQDPMKA